MVVWVVSGAASTGGSGMQKAAAVRAYGEGEQQQAGMAVSWHQEGARECGGGVEWRAWRSVEAPAGCGAEKQG